MRRRRLTHGSAATIYHPVGPRAASELKTAVSAAKVRAPSRSTMFLMLSKRSRKTNRKKTNRLKAAHKAKNKARRGRIYQRSK